MTTNHYSNQQSVQHTCPFVAVAVVALHLQVALLCQHRLKAQRALRLVLVLAVRLLLTQGYVPQQWSVVHDDAVYLL